MVRPHITLSREDIFKVVGLLAALGGAWVAADARMTRVESKVEQQAETNREMKDDVREIRRDVKRLLAREHPGP